MFRLMYRSVWEISLETIIFFIPCGATSGTEIHCFITSLKLCLILVCFSFCRACVFMRVGDSPNAVCD